MRTFKPRVLKKCVADAYSARNEKIIEFAGANQDHGGLIAFRLTDDGRMIVDVYRQGSKVEVRVGKPDPSVEAQP